MEEIKNNTDQNLATGFDLDISDDKLKVWFSCSNEFVKNEFAESMLLAGLKTKGISARPNLEVFRRAIQKAAKTDASIKQIVIAEGQSPEPPVDGTIEWTGNYFEEGYYVDPESGRIDFRQKIQDPSVEMDQLLVHLTKAQNGRDGCDVFGKTIPVKQPGQVNLKPGSNVYWDEKENGYRAKCSGRVKMRRGTLDVDQVYLIKDGVGNESGNVKHNGQVIVDGDVETDFKIDATGDVEVRGLVFACDIKSGGNLTVRDGINSQPDKRIEVQGDILAKYIMNASIICSGDIMTNTEIFHSNIKTKGSVCCKAGRVLGGEIHATKGITLNEAGAKGDIKTLLVAGYDADLHAKLKHNSGQISLWKEVIKKLETGYRKLKANYRLLNSEQKENMIEIQKKIVEGEGEISKYQANNKMISQKIREISGAIITIKNMIYPGVTLRISNQYKKIDQPLVGPIYVALDKISRELKLSSHLDGIESEGSEKNIES